MFTLSSPHPRMDATATNDAPWCERASWSLRNGASSPSPSRTHRSRDDPADLGEGLSSRTPHHHTCSPPLRPDTCSAANIRVEALLRGYRRGRSKDKRASLGHTHEAPSGREITPQVNDLYAGVPSSHQYKSAGQESPCRERYTYSSAVISVSWYST